MDDEKAARKGGEIWSAKEADYIAEIQWLEKKVELQNDLICIYRRQREEISERVDKVSRQVDRIHDLVRADPTSDLSLLTRLKRCFLSQLP